ASSVKLKLYTTGSDNEAGASGKARSGRRASEERRCKMGYCRLILSITPGESFFEIYKSKCVTTPFPNILYLCTIM
ncbi:hypothetical protein, partial [Alistipes communis]|uniref:hypothetical protein n=1 Tax=Alistipes communis TaxID=2585118 RepID=UPI00307C42F3